MIFVGSPGVVQIHTGPVVTLKEVGPWFNVLDPGFNLHLRDGDITEALVVSMPTLDGIVTALEVTDAEGRQMAKLSGEVKDGETGSECSTTTDQHRALERSRTRVVKRQKV